MQTLERRLRADGFRVISFRLGGLLWNFNTRGVPTLARQIDRKIRRLRERYGIERIHIVGHSMGGLVGRYLVQESGGDDYTATVITLGSPHHGTPTAFFGAGLGLLLVSRAMWQLFPMSPLVKRLNEKPFPAGCRLVSVYSKNDLVCPWRSSVLSSQDGGDVRNVLVKGLGHMQLVEDPWVYGLILRELVVRPVDPASGPVVQDERVRTRL
jgi:triacylglycerol esterase/lipase EstA (alpha/beta hydrolase family)